MKVLKSQRERSSWLFFIVTVLSSGLFAFADLFEFVGVGIFKQTSGYPFSEEGPTPWYYKTPQLYATVNLIFGLLFLIVVLASIWAFIRVKHKLLMILSMALVLVVLLRLISGQSA